MKYRSTILLLALSAMLAACAMPDFYFMNGKITMIGNLLTLHVSDSPNASISSAGDLNIDGKVVPVTAPQRGLLMLYYQNVEDIRERSTAMSTAMAAAAKEAVKHSDGGKPGLDQKKQLESQATSQSHHLSHTLCQDEINLKAVQDQLLAQMPAFKPYGTIFSNKSADECAKD
jgi:hypothetical protein